MDKSEKRFEQDIESFLISADGGYEQFSYLNPDGHRIHKYVYDKEKALYPEVLFNFIMQTQPKQWSRYVRYYGDDAQEKFYLRLESSINEHGLIYVLKHGVEDMGINIKVCYFKPESELNENQNALCKSNVLGVTRQFAYSKNNANTIDNLDDKKKEIFSLLTYRQADAYFRHKYLHIKKTEIARYMNVTEGAVRKLIKKAEATLREYRLANEKEIKLLEAIFGSCL